MTDLFNITLQTGVLTGDKWSFTSATTDGGDLSVGAAGSLCSSCNDYGMVLLIDDANAIDGARDQVDTSDRARFRFYIDPNSITMGAADSFVVCRHSSLFGGGIIADVYLQHDGASYELDGAVYVDGGGSTGFTATDITDAPHWVEVYVIRAETNVSADGSLSWWIDGTLIETITGLDNYDLYLAMNGFQLGAIAGIDFPTTAGTFYLDEFAMNDDGSAIGPCGPCPRLSSAGGCGGSLWEQDQISVPIEGGAYQTFPLVALFGMNANRRLSGISGTGLAPLHIITQRGPFQDGESALDFRFDARTVQLLITEALNGRTEFYDRRFDLVDLLRPNRCFPAAAGAVRPHYYRRWLPAGKLQRHTDLSTTAGSAVVTSHDARFVHWGVKAGDTLLITSGFDRGTYTIAIVENDYTVTLDTALVATATDVHYEYRRGWGLRDLYFLLEAGPNFDEDSATPTFVPTGYREALRLVCHDPFWYGQEQSETWTIAQALGDLVFDGLGAWFGETGGGGVCVGSTGGGRWLFSAQAVNTTISVVYWGTREAKPIITINGPAENPVVGNTTIGVNLALDYTVAVGETVTIDTLALTVTNNLGANLQPYLSGDLASFGLYPDPQAPNRENAIFVSFDDGVYGQSAAVLSWRNRYVSL